MDVDASAYPRSQQRSMINMIKQIRSKVQDKIDAVVQLLKVRGATFATKRDENAESTWMPIRFICGRQAPRWQPLQQLALIAAYAVVASLRLQLRCRCRQGRREDLSKVVGFQMPRLTNSLRHHLSREARTIYSRFRWLLP